MRKFNAMLVAVAIPALVLATASQAAATRSAQGMPGGGGGGGSCTSQIVQGTAQGGFDLERVVEGGQCICRVTLGPGGPAADSARVQNALNRCIEAGSGGGGGGGSTGLIIGGVVTAAGLAAGLAAGGDDSPGR